MTVNKWSNCRTSDPVQVVNFGVYITINQALSDSFVIDAAVDINSGSLFMNATMQPSGGASFMNENIYDFNHLAVVWQPLPWQARARRVFPWQRCGMRLATRHCSVKLLITSTAAACKSWAACTCLPRLLHLPHPPSLHRLTSLCRACSTTSQQLVSSSRLSMPWQRSGADQWVEDR